MIDKEAIARLVQKYKKVIEEGKEKHYNEEATKTDFILPLFRALGWRIEDSNEVSKEENISGKRVDYGFRIAGIPKFFLEAKGLDESLDGSRKVRGREVSYVEQAVNYSYYKGCNWAILANFKEIIIYDATWKTNPLQSFRMALRIESFLDNFDDGLYLLSREAFEKGLLDNKWGAKSRKRPISEQLLSDFTLFRAILSKDVYTLNKDKNLTEEELDEGIQRLFDRLIFIRNCEDRELEPYELLSTLRQWIESRRGTFINKVREVFAYFNDTYDSKIFEKHLCDQVEIGDSALTRVIDGLYSTEDGSISYDFSLIDADVLGNIYEQYLGHILSKTKSRAKLTESKAKRKEEGIYYTPSYIVDYIVRNTVGELIKDRKIDISKIKVLDPACGSGSFLIKTFDLLNEYYSKKEGYSQNKLDVSGAGTTYSTKLNILKENIFGVDLDKQAVDIAQLNLLLKIAEKKKRLPILQQNIKNGNSIIDDPKFAGDKAFEWGKEFIEIIEGSRFNIVIGNPPYVMIEKIPQALRPYLYSKYSLGKRFDLFQIFVEKGIELLKDGGILGYILPNTFLMGSSFSEFRKTILEKTHILQIIDLPQGVFEGVAVDNVILILQKGKPKQSCTVLIRRMKTRSNPARLIENKWDIEFTLQQSIFTKSKGFAFNINLDPIRKRIFDKMEIDSVHLGDVTESSQGIIIYKTEEDSISGKYTSHIKSDNTWKKLLRGGDIGRYKITWSGEYLKYGKWLWSPRNEKFFKEPKILLQAIRNKSLSRRLIGTYDESGEYYNPHNLANIIANDPQFPLLYILAIFNSKASNFWYKLHFPNVNINPNDFRQLPVPKKINQKDKELLIGLSKKMLSLNDQLTEMGNKLTEERAKVEEQINKSDSEIDTIVYKIYGLTDTERKIIEESLK